MPRLACLTCLKGVAYRVLLLPALLGVAACATSGDDATGDRAPSYPAQGALFGAGIGAALGCGSVLLTDGDDRDVKHCLERGALGGAVGAAAGGAGGYVVKERSGRYAKDEERLQQQIAAAEEELEEAQQTHRAAEQAIAQHERELARLKNDVATGRASAAELNRAVAWAREDAQAVAQSKAMLDRRVAGLETEMASLQRENLAIPPELVRTRDRLRLERDRLDRQLRLLSEATSLAEDYG
jgi:hypothetical protein